MAKTGHYTFTWDHPADDVYVTGTFDNWSKSVKLVKSGSVFAKTVDLPHSGETIRYKFVVNGTWTTDWTAPQESDHSGNTNNILKPADIMTAPSSHSLLSSVAPAASTTALAGSQPLESHGSKDLPGSFPETPWDDSKNFSVNPLPATAGAGNPITLAPGDKVPDPSTYTNNTVSSTVTEDSSLKKGAEIAAGGLAAAGATAAGFAYAAKDKLTGTGTGSGTGTASEQSYGVSPIPATGGAGNPVKLAPGEKVPDPSSYTSSTLASNVKLDRASYEKSDASAYVLPPVLTKEEEVEAQGGSMFGVPSIGRGLIPESSLPMGGASSRGAVVAGPMISSVAPTSTTAALAGQVPLEPRGVPEVVTESQYAAHASPEAASSPVAVQEKSEVENELKSKVSEAPATSTSGIFGKSEKGIAGVAAGGLAAAGAAIGAAVYGSSSISERQTTTTVPETVIESQQAAHVSPEAASSPVAVQEKSEVEKELMSRVSEAPATSTSGTFGKSEKGIAGMAAGGLAAAGAATYGSSSTSERQTTTTVPETVVESQQAAHVDPEAAASPVAVQEKSQVENELLKAVPEAPATSESGLLGKSEKSSKVPEMAAGGLAAAGATAAGLAYAARDKAASATGSNPATFLPSSVQSAIDSMNTGLGSSNSNGVPPVVTESQKAAHVAPEASASPVMVAEKSAMEKELLKEVPAANESGVSAPSSSGAINSMKIEFGNSKITANGVPPVVTESQKAAHFAPEASASPVMVAEKSAMEKELLKEVPAAKASGVSAPTTSASLSSAAPVKPTSVASKPVASSFSKPTDGATAGPGSTSATKAVAAAAVGSTLSPATAASSSKDAGAQSVATQGSKLVDSRDVSPMSKGPITSKQTAPIATTGAQAKSISATSGTATTGGMAATSGTAAPSPVVPTGSSPSTPQKSAAPASQSAAFNKGTPESSRTTDSKATKKRSFFGKLKDKLKN